MDNTFTIFADIHCEIRSVIDIWLTHSRPSVSSPQFPVISPDRDKSAKSNVNHIGNPKPTQINWKPNGTERQVLRRAWNFTYDDLHHPYIAIVLTKVTILMSLMALWRNDMKHTKWRFNGRKCFLITSMSGWDILLHYIQYKFVQQDNEIHFKAHYKVLVKPKSAKKRRLVKVFKYLF